MGTHATIVAASSPAQIAKAIVTVNQALGLRHIGLDALWKLYYYYALASNASAAQPEGRLHVGSDDETGQRLASRAAYPSSLARSALRRQTPEVRAGCSNRACPDLCGGCTAMGIPTAILGQDYHKSRGMDRVRNLSDCRRFRHAFTLPPEH